MESTTPAKIGKGASFTFLLGTFAVFAVLLSLFQVFNGERPEDPRAADRTQFTAEVRDAQKEIMTKTGLTDKAKASAIYAKTAEALKVKAATPSKMVVPGSPTQLNAVAPAAAANPAATAPATK